MNSTLTTQPCRVRADAEFTAVPLRSAIRPRLPSTTGCGNPPQPGSPGHAHWLPDSMPAPGDDGEAPWSAAASQAGPQAARFSVPLAPASSSPDSQPLSPEIRPFPNRAGGSSHTALQCLPPGGGCGPSGADVL